MNLFLIEIPNIEAVDKNGSIIIICDIFSFLYLTRGGNFDFDHLYYCIYDYRAKQFEQYHSDGI